MNDQAPGNRYQSPMSSRFSVKGIHVVQGLIGIFLILDVCLLYSLFGSSHGVLGYRNQCRQVRELEEKVLHLKRENQRLFHRIQNLKSDAQAQERLVRQHLGWVREDELVIEFSPTPQEPSR